LGQLITSEMDRNEMLYEMEDNFQILCHYHNTMKGGKIDPRNPKTYQIFEKVLAINKKYYLSS
jgi:hypothetical protein